MLALIAIAGFLLLMTLLLLVVQRSMIYFPRPYDNVANIMASQTGARAIVFTTSAGRQQAWYRPAPSTPEGPPPRLWVFFAGNASVGLDWLEFVERVPDPDVAVLLVDYPGYGFSQGRATRTTILETVEALMPALAEDLGVAPDEVTDDLNALGYSLGAAVALEFATRHPVERVVLLAPFTRLLDMARRSVGWPLMYLLYDRFDNIARLQELAARPGGPPVVTILHGDADQIVPQSMGRALAERFPDFTTFVSLDGTDHNWIMEMGRDEMLRAMDATTRDEHSENGID
jgi:uncharacterized protein